MANFICPICCISPCDSLTFGISTTIGGDKFTICMACERGMSMDFSLKKLPELRIKTQVFYCNICNFRTAGIPTASLPDERICPICKKVLNP